MIDEIIWTERYRPQKLDDIIGQDAIIKRLKASVERGSIQHLLFSGPPGVGKSTASIALAKELFGNDWKSNFKELNASDERGLDVIRNQVKEFAGAQSLGKAGFKIILLDEADSLTKDAMNALRRIMERYSKVCKFILSCNYQSKIISPIQSRCAVYKFNRVSNSAMKKRLLEICRLESVAIDDDALEAICYVAEGDMRKAINSLETAYLMGSNITLESIYKSTGTARPEVIIDFIKSALMGERGAFDLLDIMLYEKGLTGIDILKAMFKEVMSMNIKDKQMVDIIDVIGDVDFRISEGADEAIQMKWLIARIMNIAR
ncbi:MAG: replication factor C small subunit [Terriglobia bacterium]|jgi:replication factor C small subunit